MPLDDFDVEPHADPERRRHARYRVHGSLVLETEQGRYEVAPVDLGLGGILFQGDRLPPVHSKGRMRLTIDDFSESITGEVQVIDIRGTLAAGVFLLPWTVLTGFIVWLDSRARDENSLPVLN